MKGKLLHESPILHPIFSPYCQIKSCVWAFSQIIYLCHLYFPNIVLCIYNTGVADATLNIYQSIILAFVSVTDGCHT